MRFLVIAICLFALAFSDCPQTVDCPKASVGAICESGKTCPEYSTGYLKYKCVNNVWADMDLCRPDPPKDFSYPSTDFELLVSKPMTEINPIIKCYKCSYLVKIGKDDAVLPTGITLSKLNGTISGTPTVVAEKQMFTIVARNINADVETTISFLITSEKGNTTIIVIIVVCVVLILAVIGLCLFFRIKGTGRARKQRTLKTAGGAKVATATRV